MIYFIIIAACYMLLVGALIYGWEQWEKPLNNPSFQPTVTILIACRNESSNIKRVIKDIQEMNYPKELMEVIIVDDHSEDETAKLANLQLSSSSIKAQVISLAGKEAGSGKKAAIACGMAAAEGELVLTTDADCRLPRSWVDAMIQPFIKPYVLFVSGPVVFDNSRFINKIMHHEFLSLIGTGGATLAHGIPTMANGANMAVRKAVFDKLNPYQDNEHIPSGDDEFLMKKVSRMYKHSVVFLKDSQAVVTSNPPVSISEWMWQRKRWAGKWRVNKRFFEYLIPVFLVLFHAGRLTMTVLLILSKLNFELWFTALVMRAMIEYIFLKQVHEGLDQHFSWPAFLFWQIIYPFYAVFFGISANFGKYKWKGRTYTMK